VRAITSKNCFENVKNEKKIDFKNVIDVQIYLYTLKKKDLFGCFEIKEIRGGGNGTSGTSLNKKRRNRN